VAGGSSGSSANSPVIDSATDSSVANKRPQRIHEEEHLDRVLFAAVMVPEERERDPSAADVQVLNLTTNQTIMQAVLSINYDLILNIATVQFPGYPAGRLPDGSYRLSVSAAGVADIEGRPLDGNGDGVGGDDFAFDFAVLQADANLDRSVKSRRLHGPRCQLRPPPARRVGTVERAGACGTAVGGLLVGLTARRRRIADLSRTT